MCFSDMARVLEIQGDIRQQQERFYKLDDKSDWREISILKLANDKLNEINEEEWF